jgi:uncharacterized membrane protein YqiK
LPYRLSAIQCDIVKLEKLDLDLAKREKEIQVAKLEEELVVLQAALIRLRGGAEADVAHQKQMAAAAADIRMRELLLNSLPAILAEANRPIEKIREIRAISLSGGQDSHASNGSIGGVLSSASSIHLLREVLGFLGQDSIDIGSAKQSNIPSPSESD